MNHSAQKQQLLQQQARYKTEVSGEQHKTILTWASPVHKMRIGHAIDDILAAQFP